MGMGFTASLTLLGAVRELFGNGTVFGAEIFGVGYHPVIVMILPPGAFIMLGFIVAGKRVLERRMAQRAKPMQPVGCQ